MRNRTELKEGRELVTNCQQLILESNTGKGVLTGENFLPPKKATKQIESESNMEAEDA